MININRTRLQGTNRKGGNNNLAVKCAAEAKSAQGLDEHISRYVESIMAFDDEESFLAIYHYVAALAGNRPPLTRKQAILLLHIYTDGLGAHIPEELLMCEECCAARRPNSTPDEVLSEWEFARDTLLAMLDQMTDVEVFSLLDSVDQWSSANQASVQYEGLAPFFNLELEDDYEEAA